MSIGTVIKKYRKIKNLTQEEMAGRLGVTAPAVNKWENENSYPDIMLLAPIARLLDISVDTLLSFRENLTEEEINEIVREADTRLKEESYDEAFQWAKKKLEQYPNCEELILNLAVIFEAQCLIQELPEEEKYEEYLCSLYVRVLNSEKEELRVRAADSLIGFYMRKKQYEEAEKYLRYLSLQNPEKKRKQAQIYAGTGRTDEAYRAYEELLFSDYQREAEKYLRYLSLQNPEKKRKQAQIYAGTGRTDEAYRAYEELLFSDYQRVSMELQGMYMLAVEDGDMKKAHMLANKQKEFAKCFEMGRYHEASSGFELAVMEKDVDAVVAAMEELLSGVEHIQDFRKSFLYEHMNFKEAKEEFVKELKETLLKSFRDDEEYRFLQDDKRWKQLTGGQ